METLPLKTTPHVDMPCRPLGPRCHVQEWRCCTHGREVNRFNGYIHKALFLLTNAIRHFNVSRPAMEQSPDAESELLRQQRKVRPISPHLSIYQPQLTWYGSAAHRITGCAIGGGMYTKRRDVYV